MKRSPLETATLCACVWLILLGLPAAVYFALTWITHAMEAR